MLIEHLLGETLGQLIICSVLIWLPLMLWAISTTCDAIEKHFLK